MTEYTTFQVCKELGLRKERFREWIDRGYIKPSLQKAEGRGTKSLFSSKDMITVKLFSYLVESGFSRERSAEIVSHIPQRKSGSFVISILGSVLSLNINMESI